MAGIGVEKGGWCAVATALAVASPTHADSPAMLWRGVNRVGVACLVNTDHGVDTGALRSRLCSRVVALTTAGAPVPVSAVEIGDQAMLAPDQLTLLVHASTGGTAKGGLMAVSIRPWRGGGDAGLMFGAEPRVVATDAGDAALDATLAVPLTQLLPWRTAGPRRIR